MKSLSIMFALAFLTLCGCINHEWCSDSFFFVAPKAEPNVIQIHILGAVNYERLESYEKGKNWVRIPFGTPLLEVISVGAGGFHELAYKKGVRIIRRKPGSDDKAERIFLDFTCPDDRKVEEVLRDGDIIYVPATWK